MRTFKTATITVLLALSPLSGCSEAPEPWRNYVIMDWGLDARTERVDTLRLARMPIGVEKTKTFAVPADRQPTQREVRQLRCIKARTEGGEVLKWRRIPCNPSDG